MYLCVLHFTTHDTIYYVVNMQHECSVLFDVYRLAHMNMLFTRLLIVAVVRMVSATGVQCYKNTDKMLYQYYVAIDGDDEKKNRTQKGRRKRMFLLNFQGTQQQLKSQFLLDFQCFHNNLL